MGAEMVEERLAVKGSVACAGVPAGTGFVRAIVAAGNGLEGPAWGGRCGDLDGGGNCVVAGLMRLGEVIEKGVQVADAAAKRLVDASDECSP